MRQLWSNITYLICCLPILVNAKTYTVAFPDTKFYPQYEFIDGKMKGLLPDVLRKFAKDSKLSFKMKAYPIKRYVQLFDQGEVDFILPDNPLWISKDLLKPVKYSKMIMSSPVRFYEKRGRSIESVEGLKSVATISGYVITPLDDKINNAKVRVLYAKKNKALIQMLLNERAELIFFHSHILKQMIKERKELGDKLIANKKLSGVKYNYHFSTIKHREIIDKFDEWMGLNRAWIEARAKAYDIEPFKVD